MRGRYTDHLRTGQEIRSQRHSMETKKAKMKIRETRSMRPADIIGLDLSPDPSHVLVLMIIYHNYMTLKRES